MKKIYVLLLLCMPFISRSQIFSPDSLKRGLENANNDSLRIQILGEIVDYYAFNQFDSSLYYSATLFNLAQKNHDLYGVCLGSFAMFHAFNCKGEYEKALEADLNLNRAATNLKPVKPWLLSISYYFKGLLYREMLDYPKASFQFREAVRIQDSLKGDEADNCGSYSQMALIYKSLQKPDSAMWNAREGYELATRSEHYRKFLCLSLYVLGNTCVYHNEFDLADHYFRLSIQECITYNNIYFLARNYNSLALLMSKKNKLDSTIYYAKIGLQLSTQHDFGDFILEASTLLKEAYKKQGNTDSTLKYMEILQTEMNKNYGQANAKKFQEYIYNEDLHQQEMSAASQSLKEKTRIYYLLTALAVTILLIFFIYRSGLQKQKANRDIAKAYDELKEAQVQLLHQEKMASLGELTAGIAHEIQNPLNFVNNFSDINTDLIDELTTELLAGNNEEAISIAKDIKANEQKITHHGKRADSIVKGMLQHSRNSTGIKESTDLNALVEQYLLLSYHGLKAKEKNFRAAMRTEYDQSIGNISIISQDISRVLLNLFNNAFYAVSEKEKQLNIGYEPILTVKTKRLEKKVEISVKDNGNGVPQKILDKIFQPFFTTKPTGQGTGLGLSLSYDIVKAHGGEIKVDTKEGEYTEFKVLLPV